MPMTMKKNESEALNLDLHSRANLVGKLLLSLASHLPLRSKDFGWMRQKGAWMIFAPERFRRYRATKFSKEP